MINPLWRHTHLPTSSHEHVRVKMSAAFGPAAPKLQLALLSDKVHSGFMLYLKGVKRIVLVCLLTGV